MPQDWKWPIYSTHADDLWALARQVTNGFGHRADFSQPENEFAALSVVLFAAMTIEAFLNELAFLAEGDSRVRALDDALSEVEDSRGSIRLKLVMATVALGKPIDKGSEPYQSFNLLFQVRDALVHLKPKVRNLIGGEGMQPAKLLGDLRARGLIGDPRGQDWFLELLASGALCSWALDTARGVVEHVVGLLPEGVRSQVVEEVVPRMLSA
jgi:hypothetical protein